MGKGEDPLGRKPAIILVHGGEGGHHLVRECDLVVASRLPNVLVGDRVQQLPQQRRADVGVAGKRLVQQGGPRAAQTVTTIGACTGPRRTAGSRFQRATMRNRSAGSARSRRGCERNRAGGDTPRRRGRRRRAGRDLHQVSEFVEPVVDVAASRRPRAGARPWSARRRRGRDQARPCSRSTRCAAAGSRARGVTVSATGRATRWGSRDGGRMVGKRRRAQSPSPTSPRRARDGANRPQATALGFPARPRAERRRLARLRPPTPTGGAGPGARHWPSAAARRGRGPRRHRGAGRPRRARGTGGGLVALQVEAKRSRRDQRRATGRSSRTTALSPWSARAAP